MDGLSAKVSVEVPAGEGPGPGRGPLSKASQAVQPTTTTITSDATATHCQGMGTQFPFQGLSEGQVVLQGLGPTPGLCIGLHQETGAGLSPGIQGLDLLAGLHCRGCVASLQKAFDVGLERGTGEISQPSPLLLQPGLEGLRAQRRFVQQVATVERDRFGQPAFTGCFLE